MLKIYTGEKVNVDEFEGIKFPETAQHPIKRVQCALKICKKALNEDVNVLTYSPMLIEALDICTEILNIDVEFFLNGDKIPNDHLYIIYNNLGSIYDKIDDIRIEKEFGLFDSEKDKQEVLLKQLEDLQC